LKNAEKNGQGYKTTINGNTKDVSAKNFKNFLAIVQSFSLYSI
jgi:hypothetical protein